MVISYISEEVYSGSLVLPVEKMGLPVAVNRRNSREILPPSLRQGNGNRHTFSPVHTS